MLCIVPRLRDGCAAVSGLRLGVDFDPAADNFLPSWERVLGRCDRGKPQRRGPGERGLVHLGVEQERPARAQAAEHNVQLAGRARRAARGVFPVETAHQGAVRVLRGGPHRGPRGERPPVHVGVRAERAAREGGAAQRADRSGHARDPPRPVRGVRGVPYDGAHGDGAGVLVGDRKSVAEGKSVILRVDIGGRRMIKKKITNSRVEGSEM